MLEQLPDFSDRADLDWILADVPIPGGESLCLVAAQCQISNDPDEIFGDEVAPEQCGVEPQPLERDADCAGAEPSIRGTGRTIYFPDKAAARQGLSGEQQRASNRFFRGATGKSTDFKATELEGGSYRLEFFSPANNPGYGKRYVQEIGPNGTVLREYKETIGPQGIIETKWVHGGP